MLLSDFMYEIGIEWVRRWKVWDIIFLLSEGFRLEYTPYILRLVDLGSDIHVWHILLNSESDNNKIGSKKPKSYQRQGPY